MISTASAAAVDLRQLFLEVIFFLFNSFYLFLSVRTSVSQLCAKQNRKEKRGAGGGGEGATRSNSGPPLPSSWNTKTLFLFFFFPFFCSKFPPPSLFLLSFPRLFSSTCYHNASYASSIRSPHEWTHTLSLSLSHTHTDTHTQHTLSLLSQSYTLTHTLSLSLSLSSSNTHIHTHTLKHILSLKHTLTYTCTHSSIK